MSGSKPDTVLAAEPNNPRAGYENFELISTARRTILLLLFCFTSFIDAFSNCALFSAIPIISDQLNISNSNAVWLISGYQLTFASFLLVSGRLSDIYNPNAVFVLGATFIGAFTLGAGFTRQQVPLIVLRALMGIGAALTVPSALNLIVHLYPEPVAQGKAIALFGVCGALGNILGLIIGALFVSYASWPWVFYFMSIVGFVLAIGVGVLSPSIKRPSASISDRLLRFQRLDLIGVSILTAAQVLFIYGVTTGSSTGWPKANCLAPLIISVFLTIGFVIWENRLPEEMACIPASIWSYTNFGILLAAAFLPYTYWSVVQLGFSWYWQDVFGWRAIIAAVHFLPLGIASFIVTGFVPAMHKAFGIKWVLVGSHVLTIIGTILLPFANTPARYWSFAFPGFVLGTSGMAIAFSTVNISIFAVTPRKIAGVVGAMLNSSQQLGCAAGLAIATSILTSVDVDHGSPNVFVGRAASFWFMIALIVVISVPIAIFMSPSVESPDASTTETLPELAKVGHASPDSE